MPIHSSVQSLPSPIHYEERDTSSRTLHNPSRLLRWYGLTDALALAAGFLCAWALSAMISHFFLHRAFEDRSVKLMLSAAIAGGVLLWFLHTGHYRMRMPFWLECRRVAGALALAMMVDGFVLLALKHEVSRLWLTLGWAIAAVFIIGLRNLMRAYWRKRNLYQIPTLLIGGGDTAAYAKAALRSEPDFGYEIAAQVHNLPIAFLQAGASWTNLCAQYNADHIIIALDGADLEKATRPLAQLARDSVPFSLCPPLGPLPVHGMQQQYFFNHDTLLLTRSSALEQPVHRFLKRLLDIAASGTALVLLSPFMFALAFLVRRDGGPAFYRHTRIGQNGKAFGCLKFRSMRIDGDAVLRTYLAQHPEAQHEWQTTRKLQNDPRITKVGRFLRRSSLDELPQLFNVLRGDMSLVGPRPIVTDEVHHYDGDIAHYYRVRPGITGLWQVSGRNDVSYQQRVHMDSWYVRNWSLWHDIAILCKTFPALLSRSGAY
ncbi:MAG TPA: undecaprenyl-phosphate galactose phosphotransferase WbaP [Rickettsiales bacterium]|nr:undecaprenyl-phosphate galactose phosphotransferase WbaP [Rickettsiales bacterium]